MSKKVFITDKQLNLINEEEMKIKVKTNHISPDKVLLVKKYLDKAFKRGNLETIDDNGYPKEVPIVAMIGNSGEVLRNMTDVQLFYLLQDRFSTIYGDKDIRDAFLIQLLKDWFYNKITKEGLLSVNMF